jgi:hypothetical protein
MNIRHTCLGVAVASRLQVLSQRRLLHQGAVGPFAKTLCLVSLSSWTRKAPRAS